MTLFLIFSELSEVLLFQLCILNCQGLFWPYMAGQYMWCRPCALFPDETSYTKFWHGHILAFVLSCRRRIMCHRTKEDFYFSKALLITFTGINALFILPPLVTTISAIKINITHHFTLHRYFLRNAKAHCFPRHLVHSSSSILQKFPTQIWLKVLAEFVTHQDMCNWWDFHDWTETPSKNQKYVILKSKQ